MSSAWRKKPVEQWTEADERAFVEHLMEPAIDAVVHRVRVILKGIATSENKTASNGEGA